MGSYVDHESNCFILCDGSFGYELCRKCNNNTQDVKNKFQISFMEDWESSNVLQV